MRKPDRAACSSGAVIAAIIICVLTAGCQTNSAGRYLDESGRYDMTSVHQLVARQPFEAIDLVKLLDPDGQAWKQQGLTVDQWGRLPEGERIDLSFGAFYTYDNGNAAQLVIRRNRIQERILAGSTQRCNSFKQHLQRAYSRTNFTFGVLSTVAGIVGAVVESATDAKRLAAASGIFGGVRAEWNQDFLANLTVNVIVAGIESRQSDLYEQVAVKGQTKPIGIYPVEAAVKDALFIHGQCSVITGLQVASDSIKLIQNPGLEMATEILMRVQNAQKVANGEEPDTGITEKIAKMRTPSTLVGTVRKEAQPPSDVVDELSELQSLQARVAADLPGSAPKSKTAIDALKTAITAAKCDDKMRALHQASLKALGDIAPAAADKRELLQIAYLQALGAEESMAAQLRRALGNVDASVNEFRVGIAQKGAKPDELDTKLSTDITNNATNLVPAICK